MTSKTADSDEHPAVVALKKSSLIGVITISAGITAWIIGGTAAKLSGDHNAPWIIGRASGITAYILLLALVVSGLLLSHPWRTHYRGPSSVARIRIHATLAVFTLAFVILHVVVLATDPYAGVGVVGSLLPFGAEYRPAAVSLGVIGMYAGIAAGVTASLSGRITNRIWWPIHKIAAVTLLLIWAHAVWAGNDTVALTLMYIVTGVGVVVLAASRYIAKTPTDRADDLTPIPIRMLDSGPPGATSGHPV